MYHPLLSDGNVESNRGAYEYVEFDELDDDTRSLISYPYVRRFFVFCSFFMATRDIFKAFLLTVVFVIILNEFLPTEKEESEDDKKKGGSYNKQELDKTIYKLKSIQATM